MSHATRKRTARARRQPYAWLGVGAVALGMGAAMVGGTAVAFADTGADTGNTSNSASDKPGTDSSAKTDAPRRGAHSAARGANADSTASAGAATSAHRVRTSAVDTSDAIPTASEPDTAPVVENNKPLPAAAVATRQSTAVASAPVSADPAPAASTTDVSAPTPAADPSPAAAVAPAPAAADPAPSMDSWLPVTPLAPGVPPIAPGFHVALATDQITEAQALIKQETWGSGNVLAGLGSFGPQAALAAAQMLLGLWSSTIADAQKQVADTVGQPLIHNIAQARLQNELTYTKLAGVSLQTASALITPLGWLGADVAESQALVADAQQNGKVYAKVPVTMVAGTEPVVKVKINGGAKAAKLMVDTGASGVVTTRDKIGSAALGSKTGEGNSCFSGGLCYHYDTYNTTVDLGDGAVATAPVNIVTDTPEYPDSVKNFKAFFAWGADGILGVAANSVGPGPTPIPTAAMPGELSDGVLIYEKANLFGGYLILGPNLFPTRVSVPGASDAYVDVSLNGAPQQLSGAIIDSGGVYGTILRKDIPAGVTPVTIDGVEYLPAGVKISVYKPGTTTLLYTYTTIRGGTPVIDTGLFNTGNAPHALGPIYLNYGTTPYTGIGSTDFSIY